MKQSMRAVFGMVALVLCSLLIFGCATQQCDTCEQDEDCDIEAIEGASCVTQRCCINPGTPCTEADVVEVCGPAQ